MSEDIIDQNDRRERGPRAAVEINVDLSTLGVYFLSKIVNISTGGAFICHPDVKPLGTTIKISFKLPNDSKPIETQAQVTWIYIQGNKTKPSSTGMGVKFLQIQPADQKKIEDYIRESLSAPRKASKKR